jgi:hypothetical protein
MEVISILLVIVLLVIALVMAVISLCIIIGFLPLIAGILACKYLCEAGHDNLGVLCLLCGVAVQCVWWLIMRAGGGGGSSSSGSVEGTYGDGRFSGTVHKD